jgi:acetyltransferase-like isoleucine patch superfamily enzyme
MVKIIQGFLSFISLLSIRRSMEQCYSGPNSIIRYWRIRPCRHSRFCIGANSSIQTRIVFEKDGSSVFVGDRTFIGRGMIAAAKHVEIGNDVIIAWGVTISDHNSHSIKFSERSRDVEHWITGKKDWSDVKIEPVRIMDKAWIGFNSIILRGVTIGEGAIVGAGSVVTKDVLPWTIVAGNPARVIREIPEHER